MVTRGYVDFNAALLCIKPTKSLHMASICLRDIGMLVALLFNQAMHRADKWFFTYVEQPISAVFRTEVSIVSEMQRCNRRDERCVFLIEFMSGI